MDRIKQLWQQNTKGKIILTLGALILFCLACVILGTILPEPETPVATATSPESIFTQVSQTIIAQSNQPTAIPTDQPTPEELATKYANEYGGAYEVYLDFLTSTDCAHLQESFDRAYENHEVGSNNNDLFKMKYTSSYMVLTDERMEEIGCYK